MVRLCSRQEEDPEDTRDKSELKRAALLLNSYKSTRKQRPGVDNKNTEMLQGKTCYWEGCSHEGQHDKAQRKT